MKNEYEKVIQRLLYEGYLHNTRLKPAKRQISLNEVLTAGKQEPRILELLPGLILIEPKTIRNIERDLPQHPEVQEAIKNVSKEKMDSKFLEIPIADCVKQAKIIRTIYDRKKRGNRSKNLNLRVSEEDIRKLERLSRKLGKTKSETVRYLLS
jgi:hypothetical protein